MTHEKPSNALESSLAATATQMGAAPELSTGLEEGEKELRRLLAEIANLYRVLVPAFNREEFLNGQVAIAQNLAEKALSLLDARLAAERESKKEPKPCRCGHFHTFSPCPFGFDPAEAPEREVKKQDSGEPGGDRAKHAEAPQMALPELSKEQQWTVSHLKADLIVFDRTQQPIAALYCHPLHKVTEVDLMAKMLKDIADAPSDPSGTISSSAPGVSEKKEEKACSCVHSDATTCASWRDGLELDDPDYESSKRQCCCLCHDNEEENV